MQRARARRLRPASPRRRRRRSTPGLGRLGLRPTGPPFHPGGPGTVMVTSTMPLLEMTPSTVRTRIGPSRAGAATRPCRSPAKLSHLPPGLFSRSILQWNQQNSSPIPPSRGRNRARMESGGGVSPCRREPAVTHRVQKIFVLRHKPPNSARNRQKQKYLVRDQKIHTHSSPRAVDGLPVRRRHLEARGSGRLRNHPHPAVRSTAGDRTLARRCIPIAMGPGLETSPGNR